MQAIINTLCWSHLVMAKLCSTQQTKFFHRCPPNKLCSSKQTLFIQNKLSGVRFSGTLAKRPPPEIWTRRFQELPGFRKNLIYDIRSQRTNIDFGGRSVAPGQIYYLLWVAWPWPSHHHEISPGLPRTKCCI
jgi:hypothetical protein